jgi:hypothetical protein
LNAMVDQRLHFLKAQMGLAEIPAYAAPYKKLKTRVRKEAKADTPAEQKKGKAEVAPKPGGEKPAETVIPGAPAAPTPTQTSEEETKEEKPEEKKPPPPPPSILERLKRRLKFW